MMVGPPIDQQIERVTSTCEIENDSRLAHGRPRMPVEVNRHTPGKMGSTA